MIEQLRIKNFRSISDSDIVDFTGNLKLIVGKNGTGKTNLLSAIKLVADICTGTSLKDAAEKISISPTELFNHNHQTDAIEISLTINGDEVRFVYEIQIVMESHSSGSVLAVKTETLSKDGGVIYKRTGNSIENKDGKDIPLSVDTNTSVVFLYKDPAVENFKKRIGKLQFLDFLGSDAVGIYQNGNSLARDIIELREKNPKRFKAYEEARKKLIPKIASITEFSTSSHTEKSRNQDSNKDYLLVIETLGLSKKLSLRSQSLGDVKTLALIVKLFSMEENGSLFIEEAENSFHIARLREVIAIVKTVAFKLDLQIVITSHNSLLIDMMSADQVVYASWTANKGSTFLSLGKTGVLEKIQKVLDLGGEMSDYLNKLD